MSAHIAMKWSWHLSSRIPLTNSLTVPLHTSHQLTYNNLHLQCVLSFSLQSQFSTPHIPSFWLPERCTLRTPFCKRQTEMQPAWRALLLERFVWPAYNVKNKCGKITFITKEILWTNNLNLVDDVPMTSVNVHATSCKVPIFMCKLHSIKTFNLGTTWRQRGSYEPRMLYLKGKTRQNHRKGVCVSIHVTITPRA